ncbi:MAG: TonB-dependent receptor [Bacteroidota bacterium]
MSKPSRWVGLLLPVLLLVSSAPAVQAQASYVLSGRVFDETGAPVPGVTLFAVFAAEFDAADGQVVVTENAVTGLTDTNGRYRLVGLVPETYAVTAFVAGRRLVTQRVTLAAADTRLDLTLPPLEGELGEVVVGDVQQQTFGMARLSSVEGTALYDAKKTEVVVIDELTANLATNNSRQVYAKVPGLNIWESDGAGVQLGIGGRGLSPNRSSNFNTRQNGYDIAADALGYPESYYTPPVQALQRIEVVRGAASLQYGTQFGGLLNFVFQEGAEDRPLEVNVVQSAGSFGLFNSFNSVGGTLRRTRYYGFYQYKRTDGWRPNAGLYQHTGYAAIQHAASERLSLRAEFTLMRYLAQQPGGLTDLQFDTDPRQSNRERNWFRVDWNLLALSADYTLSPRTALNTRFFGLVAGRDALGNLGRIDRIDFGGNRDLLRDDFRNWGNETRLIHRYPLRGQLSVLLLGARYYDGFTDRRQGDGTEADDADFRYLNPDNLEGSDFDLPSQNVSVFAENIFNLTPRLSLTPGVRFEYIRTEAEGYYRNIFRDLAGNVLLDERIPEARTRNRSFVFFGIGASYKQSPALEVYANISQNYRAINFNDIRVNVGSLRVDPDIQDERGFNADLGARGLVSGVLNYDVSLFHLSYADRIGSVLRREPNPQFNNLVDRVVRFRTNIADARIWGLESFAEADLYRLLTRRTTGARLSTFLNLALITAEYAQSDEPGITGNRVELVPETNLRTGITAGLGPVEATYQFSWVSEQFSDASNAIRTPTAIEGVIPAYRVMDLSVQVRIGRYRLETGINNLTDEVYFTRRATGYPGPGIIPSEGRSVYLTAGVRL